MLPLTVARLLLPLPVESPQLRPARRLDPRCRCQLPQKLRIPLLRVPPHDAPHRRVRLQGRRIHPQRPALQQPCLRHPREHPREHRRVRLQIDPTPRPRYRRMVRRPLHKIQLQELPKTQRVTHPPCDPTLRILPLEESEQKQPEIPARRQSRTPHPLRVEARAFLLHEAVESRFLQNPVQPIVERMPRRSRKLRRRYPQLLLLRLAASQCHTSYLIPSRLTRETFSTGC